MSWPSAFKEARPLAFNPPDGDLPSERVQAPAMSSLMVKRGHLAPAYLANGRTLVLTHRHFVYAVALGRDALGSRRKRIGLGASAAT